MSKDDWFPPQYLVRAANDGRITREQIKERAEKAARLERMKSHCLTCELECLIFVDGGVEHHPLYVCGTCRQRDAVKAIGRLSILGGPHRRSVTDAHEGLIPFAFMPTYTPCSDLPMMAECDGVTVQRWEYTRKPLAWSSLEAWIESIGVTL